MFRQGDILITRVPEIPSGLEKQRRSNGKLVLAEGEVTGHCHAIADRDCDLFRQGDMDDMADRFLRVESEVRLEHDEHATILIPPGNWMVRRQREYSPAAPVYVAD